MTTAARDKIVRVSLSELARQVGVSVSLISMLSKGQRQLTRNVAMKMGDAWNLDPEALLELNRVQLQEVIDYQRGMGALIECHEDTKSVLQILTDMERRLRRRIENSRGPTWT